MYLGLTGFRLKSKDVYYAGIATHYISSDRVDLLVQRLSCVENSSDITKIITELHSISTTVNYYTHIYNSTLSIYENKLYTIVQVTRLGTFERVPL